MVTVVGIINGCGLGIDMCHGNYRIAKSLMVEKSNKFDECMLNHQSFSYQNVTLRKSWYCIFYVRL